MAVDNGLANLGSGGLTFRLLLDTDGAEWAGNALGYPTSGSAGAWGMQVVDGTHGLPVNCITCALPSGAATSAKQDTGNTSLASIDGKITAVNTGAVVIASGSLTANAGTNLNTSALALEAGGNLAAIAGAVRAEDSASSGGQTGIGALAIQLATPADTAADGDYSFLQMSAGRLWVDASGKTLTVASHAVTVASGGIASGAVASGAVASGAFASGSIASGAIASGAIAAGAIAAGATSIADNEDAASADGDRGVKILAVRKATPANTSGTDGDYEFLQMSAGRLWVSAVIDGLTKSIKTVSGTLTADTDVIAAVSTKRIKVIAYSIFTTGTNANAMIFKSNGTSGTELWRLILQSVASQVYGANLATAAPSFLFATVAGEKLTLDVGNGDTIHYSISYFDDDAT